MYGYGPGAGPGADWGWWPMGFGMMGLGFLVWVLIVALVVWLIVFLVRRYGGHGAPGAMGGDRAAEMLRERYARGEIDRETFTNMMKDLQEHRPKW